MDEKRDLVSMGKMLSLKEMVKNYEKKVIKELIDQYGNDTDAKQKIAERLGINIVTLYRKLNS